MSEDISDKLTRVTISRPNRKREVTNSNRWLDSPRKNDWYEKNQDQLMITPEEISKIEESVKNYGLKIDEEYNHNGKIENIIFKGNYN